MGGIPNVGMDLVELAGSWMSGILCQDLDFGFNCAGSLETNPPLCVPCAGEPNLGKV